MTTARVSVSTLRVLRPVCFIALAALALLGCSSSSEPSASLVLVTGQETDTFSRAPQPVRLDIRALSPQGSSQLLLSAPWPLSQFDLGDQAQDQTFAFEAKLLDATGATIIRGQTLFMDLSSLDQAEVPLLLGRTNETSRPKGLLSVGRKGALADTVAGRFLVLAGGVDVTDAQGAPASESSASLYDLGKWDAVQAPLPLPRVPKSFVMADQRYGLLIDEQGASWFDFASQAGWEAAAPAGIAFSEVAGGAVVDGPDGVRFVVGPTRQNASVTSAVLQVSPDQSLVGYRLNTPRQGAAACWVSGRGLVVLSGDTPSGQAEILPEDGQAFAPLPFAPDLTVGSGALALDEHRVLQLGGTQSDSSPAAARLWDLSCTSGCVPQALLGLAAPLQTPQLFSLGEGEVLAAGENLLDPQRLTALIRLSGLNATASAAAVTLRVPRQGATAISLLGHMVAIAGGTGPSGQPVRDIEVFIPPR